MSSIIYVPMLKKMPTWLNHFVMKMKLIFTELTLILNQNPKIKALKPGLDQIATRIFLNYNRVLKRMLF